MKVVATSKDFKPDLLVTITTSDGMRHQARQKVNPTAVMNAIREKGFSTVLSGTERLLWYPTSSVISVELQALPPEDEKKEPEQLELLSEASIG